MESDNQQPSCNQFAVAVDEAAISDTSLYKNILSNGTGSLTDNSIMNGHTETTSQVVSNVECDLVNSHKMNSEMISRDEFDRGEQNITARVAELEGKVASTIKMVGSLTTHCATLETTCSQLQAENRTLEENADLMKQEHARINARLMSVLAAVAKLSAINGSHATAAEGNGDVKTTTTNRPTSEAAKVEVDKANTTAVQAAVAVSQVDLQLQTIKQQITDNDKAMKLFSTRIDGVDSKIDWLETELQRYVRRHSLIIENFCPKEDRSASEIFLLFSNSVLNVALDESDIDSLHIIEHPSQAVGASKQGSATGSPEKARLPRPILVTFTCYRARAQVYRAWLTFRSSTNGGGSATGGTSKAGTLSGERGQGLCVREFLTETQDAVYRQATVARDKHLIADCWTFKGKTFMRTAAGEIREFVSTEQSVPKEDSRCRIM